MLSQLIIAVVIATSIIITVIIISIIVASVTVTYITLISRFSGFCIFYVLTLLFFRLRGRMPDCRVTKIQKLVFSVHSKASSLIRPCKISRLILSHVVYVQFQSWNG